MSGAGNDFIVLGGDDASALQEDLAAWARKVCRRGVSVGADGVLLVERAAKDRVRVRFYNPDGSEAFCGNGSRCAARYAHERGLAGDRMVLDTVVGDVLAEVSGSLVRLVLPAPRDRGERVLTAGGERLAGRAVFAGVPHFVVFVEDVSQAPLASWGPVVRHHACFGPEGTNLDLVEARSSDTLVLRTWERGVEGETLSCGSGAIAAAHAWRLGGGAKNLRLLPASGIPVRVELPGSAEAPEAAILEGDARLIFEGLLHSEATDGF